MNSVMDSYQETFDTWNKVAGLYQERFMDLDIYNDTYDLFCASLIKNNPSILEVGCGPGNITKYMLSRRNDFQIEGIDISPNMIDLAKKNNSGASFKVFDSRDLHLWKGVYDGIVCGFCLPYLSKSDVAKLIGDCKSLMSEDGVLYLSFVEGNYAESGYLTASTGDRTYFYYYQSSEITELLLQNSFAIINTSQKEFTASSGKAETHTIIIARRKIA